MPSIERRRVWTTNSAGTLAGMTWGIYYSPWAILFNFPDTACYTWRKPHLSFPCRNAGGAYVEPCSSFLELLGPKRFYNFLAAQFVCLALENSYYLPASLFLHGENMSP